ncbi:uncharacterized protein LOC144126354 [Amblyomma americanum]
MSAETYHELNEMLTFKMKNTLNLLNSKVFSKFCLGAVTAEGGICVSCRYLRKALVTRKSKLNTKTMKRNLSQRLRITSGFRNTGIGLAAPKHIVCAPKVMKMATGKLLSN